jgi:hypothetical protein
METTRLPNHLILGFLPWDSFASHLTDELARSRVADLTECHIAPFCPFPIFKVDVRLQNAESTVSDS